MRDHRSTGAAHGQRESSDPGGPAPGKRSLVETMQLAAIPGATPGDPGVIGAMPASGGALLPDPVRGKMERSFGADFSGVNVHQDGRADAMGAKAYAQGETIPMGKGEHEPASHAGQSLIGHELAHVVQQREGRASGGQGKGGAGVADASLEAEADRQGELAA